MPSTTQISVSLPKLQRKTTPAMINRKTNNQHNNSNNNSFNYRFQYRIVCTCIAIIICLLAGGISTTNAVPTDSISSSSISSSSMSYLPQVLRRPMRDAVDMPPLIASLVQDDASKPSSSAVGGPAVSPSSVEIMPDETQDQCLLEGVLVPKATVFCEKQTGCRAIQKTGHCCPDYKCDCEKDGKTYLNGDKLVDPETPCTFCYCQGGEIFCNSVKCFHQDNCIPKYIPGRCCPEYDNCPVSTNNTMSTVTTTTTTMSPPEQPAMPFNTKITIKEITKPTEIRITDDNKAIIHPMLKVSTTTTTTTTIKPQISGESFSTAPAPSPSTNSDNNHQFSIPIGGGINRNESLKLSASVAYPVTAKPAVGTQLPAAISAPSSTSDNRSNSSEDDNSDAPADDRAISTFAPQGLQHVEGNADYDPSKVNIKREYSVSTEGAISPEDFASSSEINYSTVESIQQSSEINGPSSIAAESEPDAAGSDNIYRIILTTDGPRYSSTEGFLLLRGTEGTEGIGPEPDIDGHAHNISDNEKFSLASPLSPNSASAEAHTTTAETGGAINSGEDFSPSSTTEGPESSTSDESVKSSTHGSTHADEEDVVIPLESNPAYPSLPEDDFSLRDMNFPLAEVDEEVKDEPRGLVSAYDALKSTKHLDEIAGDGSGSGGGGLIMSDMELCTTESPDASGDVLEAIRRDKIEIMNSGENLSSETAIANSSNFEFGKIRETAKKTSSEEALEIESDESLIAEIDSGSGNGSGGGSGSGELMAPVASEYKMAKAKQREPTTPRPTAKPPTDLDIDELGGEASGDDGKLSSPAEDPKLDVESLKVNENDESHSAVAQPEAGTAGDGVLTIQTNPAQDKTAEEGVGRVQRLILHRVY